MATSERLRLVKPRQGGRHPVKVGRTTFGVMPGSRITHSADERLCWVLDPNGEVYCLTEAGQVEPVSAEMQAQVKRVRFGVT